MRKTIILVAVAAVVAFMAFAVYSFASDSCCPKKAAATPAAKADTCSPQEKAACPLGKDDCPSKDSCPMDAKACPMKSGTAAKNVTASAVTCPVKGGKIVNTKTAQKSTYKGKTYYFCCAPCKKQFDANPAKYLKSTPKAAAKAQDIKCPVMGGKVTDTKTALKSTYKGKTYYFCCPGCKPKFDANPAKYAGKA